MGRAALNNTFSLTEGLIEIKAWTKKEKKKKKRRAESRVYMLLSRASILVSFIHKDGSRLCSYLALWAACIIYNWNLACRVVFLPQWQIMSSEYKQTLLWTWFLTDTVCLAKSSIKLNDCNFINVHHYSTVILPSRRFFFLKLIAISIHFYIQNDSILRLTTHTHPQIHTHTHTQAPLSPSLTRAVIVMTSGNFHTQCNMSLFTISAAASHRSILLNYRWPR